MLDNYNKKHIFIETKPVLSLIIPRKKNFPERSMNE